MRDDNTPEYRSLLFGGTRETFSPGTVGYELLGMVESLHARANSAEAEVNRLTECLEAMNASADILDEKIRVISAFVERTGLTSVYGRLDAHEVDELNAILAAETPTTYPTGQE